MVVATSDGGSTDMGCCYQVESIVGLFNVCYFALYKRLTSNMNGKYSILQYILDAEKLEIGRGRYKQQANNKLNQFTGGSDFRGSTSFVNIRAPQTENRNKMTATDAEAEMLIKSYNQDVAAFMPPTRANKRKQETKEDKTRRKEEGKEQEKEDDLILSKWVCDECFWYLRFFHRLIDAKRWYLNNDDILHPW
jgi:hypothetical protein